MNPSRRCAWSELIVRFSLPDLADLARDQVAIANICCFGNVDPKHVARVAEVARLRSLEPSREGVPGEVSGRSAPLGTPMIVVIADIDVSLGVGIPFEVEIGSDALGVCGGGEVVDQGRDQLDDDRHPGEQNERE